MLIYNTGSKFNSIIISSYNQQVSLHIEKSMGPSGQITKKRVKLFSAYSDVYVKYLLLI